MPNAREKLACSKSLRADPERGSQDYERRCRFLDRRVRALEQDRLRLSTITNHADLGLLIFAPSLKLIRANRSFMLRFWPGSNPEALKLYPTDVWALHNRGLAWKGQGKLEDAERDWQRVQEIEPGFKVPE